MKNTIVTQNSSFTSESQTYLKGRTQINGNLELNATTILGDDAIIKHGDSIDDADYIEIRLNDDGKSSICAQNLVGQSLVTGPEGRFTSIYAGSTDTVLPNKSFFYATSEGVVINRSLTVNDNTSFANGKEVVFNGTTKFNKSVDFPNGFTANANSTINGELSVASINLLLN
ncbi:hypothetical protein [uncultured Clostridium sp.]|uniref:hypothetical protein n=1 Tax=uncultured Clostridium sp. TaxID=59620 RepID=UPI00260561F2|nr:hypothetical protein [uncultured Clostridium sp.]